MGYQYRRQPYVAPPELLTNRAGTHPVVIVGAGPIGLALAIDLALHGIKSTVLDDNDVVSFGSRAICWAKRTLEIFDRLGVAHRMMAKGVTWNTGRVFQGEDEIYHFDLMPDADQKFPAFINLQQYYVEEYLIDRAREFPDLIELRFKNRLDAIQNHDDGVTLEVHTPDGSYNIDADYVLACDGVRSTIRQSLKLDFEGEYFEERFLIADIEMQADFPSERHFWFEPTFHPGQSALLHKQPDNIYRIDLQLGVDADPDEEKKPQNVLPRIEKVLGGRPFELNWVSIYSFQCRRLERFIHDRVIFVGDSAHVVSPFGARGGNGGIQDVDNLGWKLAMTLNGQAGPGLLQSYDTERVQAADENIMHSSRSTRFMSPENGSERLFRDVVLDLAQEVDFARPMVNSGRLSSPCIYDGSPLNGHDTTLPAQARPGAPILDAPLTINDSEDAKPWLSASTGNDFELIGIDTDPPQIHDLKTRRIALNDALKKRYLGDAAHAVYLIRPDQHVAARWIDPRPINVEMAHSKARGFT